ncbi:MAG: hypothetical protein ACLQBL_26640 [Polyangiaceae bacterium]
MAIAIAACGCGSSGGGGNFQGGGTDASFADSGSTIGEDASLLGNNEDAGVTSTGCIPKTCAQLSAGCGQQGDGCGGSINCGTCTGTQTCGGGGTPNQCGGSGPCVPATTCPATITCGPAADGCGGLIASCGTCTAPQSCGGGGTPSQCGQASCVPATACPTGQNCGVAADGCGGTISCGTCTAPASCGGGGVHSQCGVSVGDAGPDGGPLCVPLTTCPAGQNCGAAADGCGGTIASCGTCTAPQICGGGGTPNQCGDSTVCTPATSCPAGQNCGVAPDGCGGSITCGTCTSPNTCGGGGVANQCGQPTCTPLTCTELGYNCGVNGNGCGGLTPSCGTCTAPEYCGGGGTSVCGPTSAGGCDSGTPTTLSGFVFDPANNLPVDNVLVYVPTGTVQTPQTGVNPAVCGCSAPSAYASAYTAIDGSFTLTNVPAGSAVTVVIQLGKWQRVYSESITGCTANTLSSHLTLPSTHLEGNIPLFAIDTGGVDSMECVLLKMGIAQSEFVDPAIAGGVPTAVQRVHFYEGSIVSGGAVIDGATPTEAALTETATVMDSYDIVLFPCQGGAGDYDKHNGFPNTLGNLINYTTAGGRMFATHFHYDLLDGNGSFSGTAKWKLNNGTWGDYYGDPTYTTDIIGATPPPTFTRGQTLAQWINQAEVYGGTYGQIPVGVIRNDFTSVVAPAQLWIDTNGGLDSSGNGGGPAAGVPIHYTFETPFVAGGADGTCGRVVYSDFHVESQVNGNNLTGEVFPSECQGLGPPVTMTPQEKLLEFMLFDLTSCVSPPTCTPKTCAQQGIQCGSAGDGCGNIITGGCGTCTPPAVCGGGGPGICGTGCTPVGCPAGQNCGIASNGCGGSVACGTCTPPATCGGGGVANECGAPTCTPQGCPAGQNCGQASNGCGGLTASCGTCTPPEYCGGGGAGVCGIGDAASCVPLTCAAQGVNCGQAGDGCGGVLDCGTCPGLNCPTPAQTCGGGGTANVCGSACTPTTCTALGLNCGPAGDGCGCTLECGTCTAPQTCGGGGTPGVCGAPACTPTTCAALGLNCGPAGDGCGGTLQCGTCTAPETCGGGGTAGVCGSPTIK